MPGRTGYAHGVPNWVDLATSDVDGAKAFYTAMFGWTYDDQPMPEGVYSMVSKDGKLVAGLSNLPAGMDQSVWSTYLAVDDVDAATAKATEAGGAVVMGPMDVFSTGRMSFITDPTGAAIGLWEARDHFGAELVNEHGSFTWNELLTDDIAAAEQFYSNVFGYRVETTDMPNGPYVTFWAEGNVEGNAAAGMLSRTPEMGSFPNYWGVYLAVDDCDASAASAEANGGQVLAQPMDIPEVGRMAVIQDPQGAVFSIIKLVREQR